MLYLISYFLDGVRQGALTVRRLGRLFATILLLSLVAIWLLFAGILYESYHADLKSAETFVGNVGSLVELAIARNLEFYDLSLKAAAQGYGDLEVRALPPRRRQQILFNQATTASGLGWLIILDPEGHAVADSQSETPRPLDAGDRDYFQVHRDRPPSPLLYVSHPFQSRLQPGVWAIGMTRRIENPDGSFAGVALGTLKISYFMHLFGAVELPPGSTITVLHDDGTILMRTPFVDIGRSVATSPVFQHTVTRPSGMMSAVSTIDKVQRIFAFRQIEGLPMRLVVGVPTAYFVDSWRWRAIVVAGGFIILSALILGLAITLGSELHRRTLAEQSLSELAATDSLTTLPNRRSFDDILANEWSRAVLSRASVALLMVDCDFFKAYNDAYGHLQGDEGLRAIASALRDTIQRPADLVARFGGEEFVILLPGIDLDGALLVAEQVRTAVLRLAWPHRRSPFGTLTVSIGIAACLPTAERDPLALVQAADFALYEAKEKGRNQIATGEGLDLTAFGWRAAG
jgi:diguanylate cyclase (GGDEF)-like protein